MLELSRYPLKGLADQVGTPFYLMDGDVARRSMERFASVVSAGGAFGRYAMKANSARRVLDIARRAGLGIDAVSGNEVLRALRAGFPARSDPPAIVLTTDVFRDNAIEAVLEHGVLPNLGSPGMLAELHDAGYRGPISLRVNPGFGHGEVAACDTGGPSSKHGIWPDALPALRKRAAEIKLSIVGLHAHIGSGPEPAEFDANLSRLVAFFADLLPEFPSVTTVSLGGGIPCPYRPREPGYDIASLEPILKKARRTLSDAAGRDIRIEAEPGRHLTAGMAVLVARVKDVKRTRANERGPGQAFVMVDAGFNDLIRPALYGSYHHIEIVAGAERSPGNPSATRPVEPCVVAGPLCESGDVFTRDAQEFLDPRPLPRPVPGDLLVLQDVGAYGDVMASNYVSMGRAPRIWWENGSATLVARRESIDDLLATECDQPLRTSG
jgi:diaminopimelate decarboxylase